MTRARDVADTQDNIGGAVSPFLAGKNRIINGDFRINQRNFSGTSGANAFYPVDRWMTTTAGSHTFSLQTFTPGAAPVAGYEGTTFFQMATVGGSGHYALIGQKIEDVRTFAGQTVTVSFWARATSGTPKIGFDLTQNFGSGGSSQVGSAYNTFTLSTTWARYSATVTVPSISGKTIGTSSYVLLDITFTNDYNPAIGQQTATFQIWGVQVEAGSVATPFTTSTGSIQGELTACHRYYQRYKADSVFDDLGYSGKAVNSTEIYASRMPFVPFRVAPTSIDFANVAWIPTWGAGTTGISNISFASYSSADTPLLIFTTTGVSSGSFYIILAGNSSNAYIGLSAEL
jgi:hypothetical protein